MIALLGKEKKKKVTAAPFTNHPHVVHPVNRQSYNLNGELSAVQKRWLRHSFGGETQA